MQGGWALWLDWLSLVAPENQVEIDAIEADRGANLTYVRVLARRKENINLDDPLVSVPTQYTRKRLLRDDVSDTRLKLDEAPWSD